MVDKINHLDRAESRIISEYRESVNLINYFKTLLLEADNLEAVFCSLIEDRTLDTATGFTLDILGAIVGQPREFVSDAFQPFFGFTNIAGNILLNTEGFGNTLDPAEGGLWFSIYDTLSGTVLLEDEQYRLFIKARISRNFSKATPEDIITYTRFIADAPLVIIEELDDAAYNLKIGRIFSDSDQAIILSLGFIPKPVGVNVNYFDFELGNVFAFAGIPEAKGFTESPFVNPF